ncbi:MAG: hypothetical protein LBJ11_07685 [Oscillospiraceae bacterium]|nr:hypothetical protein [Oscillospiraceae bacterium]
MKLHKRLPMILLLLVLVAVLASAANPAVADTIGGAVRGAGLFLAEHARAACDAVIGLLQK